MLTIIGAGSQSASCKETCQRKKFTQRVEFTGRLPHDEAMARIADCHVLVQPSRVLETYGLTLIEALASGTNILAANRGAAREIIEASGVGFLYDADDPGNLAAQLAEIRRRHDAGTLNRFEVAELLSERSEERY